MYLTGCFFYFSNLIFYQGHVLSGTRPKLDEIAGPPEDIKRMIKNCWVEEAVKRPTARQLIAELEVAALL